MKVYLKNLQKKNPVRSKRIANLALKILRAKKILSGELSLVFVNDKVIKSINNKYLFNDRPTDVISFDLATKKYEFNGEIIISTDSAKSNALAFKSSYEQEIKLYIIHGILHLLGYNDNISKQAILMRKEEKRLLKIIK